MRQEVRKERNRVRERKRELLNQTWPVFDKLTGPNLQLPATPPATEGTNRTPKSWWSFPSHPSHRKMAGGCRSKSWLAAANGHLVSPVLGRVVAWILSLIAVTSTPNRRQLPGAPDLTLCSRWSSQGYRGRFATVVSVRAHRHHCWIQRGTNLRFRPSRSPLVGKDILAILKFEGNFVILNFVGNRSNCWNWKWFGNLLFWNFEVIYAIYDFEGISIIYDFEDILITWDYLRLSLEGLILRNMRTLNVLYWEIWEHWSLWL